MHGEPEHFIGDEIKCTIIFLCPCVFLRSPKNAFIMQSKSTFLEFLDGNFAPLPPEKFFRCKFFRCKLRHRNLPCALSVSRFPHVCVGAACLFDESVDLLFAFGVLACRILDCASLLCGLLSSKLRCLRLKIELLAF